jgi:hypothetical protein
VEFAAGTSISKLPTVGGDDVKSAGPGGEEVPLAVDVEPIGNAFLRPGPIGRIEEHAASAESSVLEDVERHPDRVLSDRRC